MDYSIIDFKKGDVIAWSTNHYDYDLGEDLDLYDEWSPLNRKRLYNKKDHIGMVFSINGMVLGVLDFIDRKIVTVHPSDVIKKN